MLFRQSQATLLLAKTPVISIITVSYEGCKHAHGDTAPYQQAARERQGDRPGPDHGIFTPGPFIPGRDRTPAFRLCGGVDIC